MVPEFGLIVVAVLAVLGGAALAATLTGAVGTASSSPNPRLVAGGGPSGVTAPSGVAAPGSQTGGTTNGTPNGSTGGGSPAQSGAAQGSNGPAASAAPGAPGSPSPSGSGVAGPSAVPRRARARVSSPIP